MLDVKKKAMFVNVSMLSVNRIEEMAFSTIMLVCTSYLFRTFDLKLKVLVFGFYHLG